MAVHRREADHDRGPRQGCRPHDLAPPRSDGRLVDDHEVSPDPRDGLSVLCARSEHYLGPVVPEQGAGAADGVAADLVVLRAGVQLRRGHDLGQRAAHVRCIGVLQVRDDVQDPSWPVRRPVARRVLGVEVERALLGEKQRLPDLVPAPDQYPVRRVLEHGPLPVGRAPHADAGTVLEEREVRIPRLQQIPDRGSLP